MESWCTCCVGTDAPGALCDMASPQPLGYSEIPWWNLRGRPRLQCLCDAALARAHCKAMPGSAHLRAIYAAADSVMRQNVQVRCPADFTWIRCEQ